MKLSKRVKQLIFGLAWGDVLITVGALLVNSKFGVYLIIANSVGILAMAVGTLFWASYKIFVGDD